MEDDEVIDAEGEEVDPAVEVEMAQFLPATIKDDHEYALTGTPPTPAKGKVTGTRRLKSHEREIRAMSLRRAGHTYTVIAEVLGYADRSGARAAVIRAMEREHRDVRREYRTWMMNRYDHMLTKYWGQMEEGNIQAGQMVLNIMDRIERGYDLNDWRELEAIDEVAEDETEDAVLVIEGRTPKEYLDNVRRLIPRQEEPSQDEIDALDEL